MMSPPPARLARPFRAPALLALSLLAPLGCGREGGASRAENASHPPIAVVDGDSAALAEGFTKLETRRSRVTTVAEAYLERARRRRAMMQKDSMLARVPASLLAAMDTAMAEALQEHADEMRARAERAVAAPSLDAAALHPGAPAPAREPIAAPSRFATLARPFSIFLPTTAWAAGPQSTAPHEVEPVVRERTTVTREGATIRARRSLREFEANGRLGFELEVRTTAETTGGGLTSRMTDEVRELVDVSYCPDASGIAAGRREYSATKGVEVRRSDPAVAHIGTMLQLQEAETAVYSGQVDDDADLHTIDGELDVSHRTIGKQLGGSVDPASTNGHARGRFVDVALRDRDGNVVWDDDSRRYVDLPRDIDPSEREGMRTAVDIAMDRALLDNVLFQYVLARMKWQSGECLEVHLVEEPEPSRLHLGERTSLVPEVRHRFDESAAGLPLGRRVTVGTTEGLEGSGSRVTYEAPGKSSPDAARFRREGAELSLRSVSRRGIAYTTVRIASAESPPEAYRVTVTLRSESTKRGVGSEYTYEATLVPSDDAEADEGDLTGSGSYRGYLVAHNANCANDAPDVPERFDVSGELEASGAVLDMNPVGAPKMSIIYNLATLDWTLKPLYGGEGPYAANEEEREAIKGLGSVFSAQPIELAGAVTTLTRTSTSESKCAGTTTRTTSIRIERLR